MFDLSKYDYCRGFKDSVPIAIGYIPIAMACGIAAVKSGISLPISQMMSLFIYSGAGQATVTNLLKGGETSIVMYALTLLVANCRYLLLSISLSQKLRPETTRLQKILIGILNTDETFGVSMKKSEDISFSYFVGLATLPYFSFAFGNIVGSTATELLPDSLSSAFGIMIFAMFIAIIIPPAKKSVSMCAVLFVSIVMAVVLECVPLIANYLTPGWIIIISSVISALIGAIFFPIKEETFTENITERR